MQAYEPKAGESIADTQQVPATMQFSATTVTANPGDSPDKLVAAFSARSPSEQEVSETSWQAWRAKELERRHAQQLALDEALAQAPASLTVEDAAAWESLKARNAESHFDTGAILFAENWGRLMEARLSNGESFSDFVKTTERCADVTGVSVSMYRSAVTFLKAYWVHGNEFMNALSKM